jgi:hypothetical protein
MLAIPKQFHLSVSSHLKLWPGRWSEPGVLSNRSSLVAKGRVILGWSYALGPSTLRRQAESTLLLPSKCQQRALFGQVLNTFVRECLWATLQERATLFALPRGRGW